MDLAKAQKTLTKALGHRDILNNPSHKKYKSMTEYLKDYYWNPIKQKYCRRR
jgi:hypothetical protein